MYNITKRCITRLFHVIILKEIIRNLFVTIVEYTDTYFINVKNQL